MYLKIGDTVYNKHKYITGRVIEVNDYWGWYEVKYVDGTLKRYTGNVRNHELTVAVCSDKEV